MLQQGHYIADLPQLPPLRCVPQPRHHSRHLPRLRRRVSVDCRTDQIAGADYWPAEAARLVVSSDGEGS